MLVLSTMEVICQVISTSCQQIAFKVEDMLCIVRPLIHSSMSETGF